MVKNKILKKIISVMALLLIMTNFPTINVNVEAETPKELDVYLLGGQSNAAGPSKIDGLDSKYIAGFPDILYCGSVRNNYVGLTHVKAGLGAS